MVPGSITTVIPAYNEGDRLFTFLQDWAVAGRAERSLTVTALVVDDGSREEEGHRERQAVEAASEVLSQSDASHQIRYLRADRNRGKGASIRWGWSQADPQATWLGFIDADGAVPAREYWRLVRELPVTPADVLCGSRVKMAGRSVERSLFRHLQGRAFATLVDELFQFGMYDTQCGLKFFRGSMLRPLLPDLREERWLLDVELLARLKAAGARCVEVPIDCHERGGSSLVLGLDPLRMAIHLVRIRGRMNSRVGGAA